MLAVVIWLTPLHPAHHAGLVSEVEVHATEDRRGLHPDDLLVVEDSEMLPHTLDDAGPFVGMPAVKGLLRSDDADNILEDGA